jgi:multicomponent Na+:H+ antiporter subunit G
MTNDITTIALLVVGTIFTLLAAIGILRMPDVFMRMQVATKAATLGVACVAMAAAVHFGDLATTARAVLIVLFLFLTAPVAAHTIGRAAYVAGARLWEGTVIDELRGKHERGAQPPRSLSPDDVRLPTRDVDDPDAHA